MAGHWRVFLLFVVIGLAVVGCTDQARPTPAATDTPAATATATATAEPTATVEPTATMTAAPTETPRPTNTARPTSTPRPTATATAVPTVALGELQTVEEGGFAFRAPAGYEVDIEGSQVGVLDPAGGIIISLTGVADYESGMTPEEIVDEFLAAVGESGNEELEKGEGYAITIGGVEGLGYEVRGSLFGSALRGEAALVMPGENFVLFGLGVANTARDAQRWENEGSRVFAAVLRSVEFVAAEGGGQTGPCPVATDESYGYSRENPIEVGGGSFGGPARERAYLDNLRGPNGEAITYERIGSEPFGETIVDIYEIRGLGEAVTLYLDEYNYSELRAPVGFSCAGAFSLGRP